ncbi:uncharacterized protein ARMOST_21906 [Armillaria ostoyae]|uniref:Integrase catalytic domain-containing protein n=1 Tax=Armillaria ostoyae TaxID=47428 RepID=A0A284SBC8_ARMOS|nr:uncharacterized protein ARMOST_21906 [Armillaria ostoyae]
MDPAPKVIPTPQVVVPYVPKDFFSPRDNMKAAGEGGPEKKKDFKRGYTPYPSDPREPAYKIRAPIQERGNRAEVMERVMNTEVPITVGELLSLSKLRDDVKSELTLKWIAFGKKGKSRKQQFRYFIEEEPEEDEEEKEGEETEQVFPFGGVEVEDVEGVPGGAIHILKLPFVGSFMDPFLQYVNEAAERGEEPKAVYVAKDSQVLRSVFPLINRVEKLESLYDTGSQIVSMSERITDRLGLIYDPDIVINMQSANKQVEKSLGMAKNVLFLFGDITVYLQIHIIRDPAGTSNKNKRSKLITERDGTHVPTEPMPSGSKRSRAGFSVIDDQGELALIIEEKYDGGFMIGGYAQPTGSKKRRREELQATYAVASSLVSGEDKKVCGTLSLYFGALKDIRDIREQRKHVDESNRMLVDNPSRWIWTYFYGEVDPSYSPPPVGSTKDVFATRKYKPVAQKVRPVTGGLPSEFRIERNIKGDPLKDMPKLSERPSDFIPTGRYTTERMEQIDKVHNEEFLWPEERKLMHHFMMEQNKGFVWDDSERGAFKEEYFPPITIPIIEHTPWVQKNIPIPLGIFDEVCKIIRTKIQAGMYEPLNSSYRSRWFCVIKKDGKSLQLIHSLEPLNAVTIKHSGVPPATDELAEHFAGRSCGATLDLYVGYDERTLDEGSRDMTTFQTPFGALRLVTLPMGWTNSVPIFHDDVTYILQAEVPHVTIPYVDDVPVCGPKTRYETADGGYETISENDGIRRFVWEHFQNVNRVVQCMKYAGGTFSGHKVVLCALEIMVMGHRCTYEGRKPETDRVGVILRWGPCQDLGDVHSFLGTVGVHRIFIKDYAKKAEPLTKLTRLKVPFTFEEEQEASMQKLKDVLQDCPSLMPIDYELDSPVILGVDTSYRAIGFYICQLNPDNPKRRRYARFGSIMLNEWEARFSQPKRELYGLFCALRACRHWLFGVWKLVMETDAKYIAGMLRNPDKVPNTVINRWIESILMFHFTLVHIPGERHAPDGLSRCDFQPGDEEYSNPENEYEPVDEELEIVNETEEQVLEIADFKERIDTRHGYVTIACAVHDFHEDKVIEEAVAMADVFTMRYNKGVFLPDETEFTEAEDYPEDSCSGYAKMLDSELTKVVQWHANPMERLDGFTDNQYKNFIRYVKNFIVDKGKLYQRDMESEYKLVIYPEHRMYIMKAAHDQLGHRGMYATKILIKERFWWPEMERDIVWYVSTCHICQECQKTVIKVPPMVSFTPSIFQVLHADTMHMPQALNGHKYIVHGHCVLTSWMEGRTLASETAQAIGERLFKEIICRWGCLSLIITDNGKQFKAAIKYLEKKYGIRGIQIAPYNSQANGRIKRPHWDVRQALYKACRGVQNKWHQYFMLIMWADRITVRKRMGHSPFFAVTGAHPILPLDVLEATWLVEYPGRMLEDWELCGLRAITLEKHVDKVEEMRQNMDTIKEFEFKSGDLVLMRNSQIESSLNTKMKPRYLGPLVVIHRTKVGNYILAELDGAIIRSKIAAFRVVPYLARKSIDLDGEVLKLMDMSHAELQKLIDSPEPKDKVPANFTDDYPETENLKVSKDINLDH